MPFGAVMSFVFGAVWGSFFNVCIYRIPAGKSIVWPGSHCGSCGTMLQWYDNVPLVSYLLLRGNCRYCGTHFSARYFGIELFSALMFLAIFLRFGPQWSTISHIVFASFLLVGTFTDIDHFILPDGVTVGGLVFALASALILSRKSLVADEYLLARDFYYSCIGRFPRNAGIGFLTPFLWALAGAAFGWTLLTSVAVMGRLMFNREAMGGGDIKLFAFLGAYLGVIDCIWVLFLSAILGASLGFVLILAHKLLKGDEYEQIELAPGRAMRIHTRIAGAQEAALGERNNVVVAQSVIDASAVLAEAQPGDEIRAEPDEEAQKTISLRIARSTSRQLHHFPFGPYIAVAAFLVLLFHDHVNRMTRDFLYLRHAPYVEDVLDTE